MKYLFTALACLFGFGVVAQGLSLDTIQIETVDIVAPRLHHFSTTEKTIKVDSVVVKRYDSKDLGNILQKISLVNLSSNGSMGALTTVSMRGASATHTSVNWNGVPVNSLTTGSADLSMVNAGSFNDIQVVYGAVGSLYGSGTLGGAIELSNIPTWKDEAHVGVFTEAGSFSNYKTKVHGKYSNSWLSYTGQAFYQYGKNDFKYTDKYDFGSPTERLTHNDSKAYGTIHDFHLKLDNHFIDFGAWYQAKRKNIGGLMGIGKPISNQQQRDSSLRVYAGWKALFGKVRLEAKTAYLYDYLKYTDKESADSPSYKIFSEIASKRWLNDVNLRWYLSSKLSVDVNGQYHWLKGITNNYKENVIENEGRVSLAMKYSPDFGTFILTYGKEWNTEVNPPEMYSVSSLVHLFPGLLDIRMKASTHYKRPTFNERYWNLSGNVDLKSEEGWNYELGLVLLEQKVLNGSIHADLNLYRAENDNLITWQPTSGNLWKPQNIGETVLQGLDVEIVSLFSSDLGTIRSSFKYGYNDSYDNDKNSGRYKKTLAYRPHHLVKLSCDLFRGKWDAGVIGTFRSHTQSWEGDRVDGNFLMDINGGYQFDNDFAKIKIFGRVENVLDKSYELVRFYPMPGRAYYLGANVTF